MRDVDQQRLELLAAPGIAADRQGAEGIAVVAAAPGNDVLALQFTLLDVVLARKLQRRLHSLGAAGNEVHAVEFLRRAADQLVGQRLHRLIREERGVREGQLVQLRLDCLND